jgi:hypothetical protein
MQCAKPIVDRSLTIREAVKITQGRDYALRRASG